MSELSFGDVGNGATIEKAVRSLLDLYKKDLQDAMDYPSQEFKFNSTTKWGICVSINFLHTPSGLKDELRLKILKRIYSKVGYLYSPPICCETTDELIYAYQVRISLLEEILIEVTPVDEEKSVGTFEQFNNILY